MKAALEEVTKLVLRESGMQLKPSQSNALRTAVARAAPGSDPESFLRLAARPVGGPELVARLVDEISINETFFLRDRRQLETIDWKLLLETAREDGAQAIRVWSAGCATGEEAYTLALLACEAFATDSPPVRVLATDISRAALHHADRGSYGPRSVRPLDPPHREHYFEERGDRLIVKEGLRNLVAFTRHNLVRDPVPPRGELPFHLILCRNVLIYFDAQTAEHVVKSLERALLPAAGLMLGAADALCVTGLPTPAQVRQPPADSGPRVSSHALRRPLGRVPEQTPAERLAAAFRAADQGELEEAGRAASGLIVDDPLNAEAYFLRGLVQLEAGDAPAAVKSLRGALYISPAFGTAAFKLGGAYEALGERTAARRAYEQALRTIEHAEDHAGPSLEQVDVADIADACQARLIALR